MPILELRNPVPVETPLGRGYAIIFESDATDTYWTVILSDTRAFVTFRQEKIRACRSYTYGRDMPDDVMRQCIGGKKSTRNS